MAASSGKKGPQPQSYRLLRNVTLILCLTGLCIAIFAQYIEIVKERNPNYVALCDINSYFTCSRALTSRYSKGFGLVEKIFSNTSILNQPNTVYGMAYYTFQATLAFSTTSSSAVVQTGASVVANIGSVYLAYILIYILKDFCVVCVSTYVVNFLILITSIIKLRRTALEDMRKLTKKKN